MKKLIPLLAFSLLITMQAEAARGRQPCSGSKGGISHCTSDGRFVCNDGSLSQSKRFCSGGGASGNNQQTVKPPVSTRKTQTKKATTVKTQERQRVAESDVQVNTQPRQPTCAPLYMASKPGFTHLPICSGNQY